MTINYRLGAAGVAMIAALGLASAANAAPQTATADAKAEIVSAFTITKASDLDFGKIAINNAGTGGTVVVANDGTPTCAATLTCYSTTSAAKFNITNGTAGKRLTVKLPTSATLLTGTGLAANEKLSLSNVTTDAAAMMSGGVAVPNYYTVDLDSSGLANFSVGGKLTVDGDEVQGAYVATLSFDVDYQ
ncbi:MAG: DUF4402 domain-containing protein [Tsuneonella sp.]